MIVILLGSSGCAGLPQQGGWSSPSGATAYGSGADQRPLARLAFWRRPRADAETTPTEPSGVTDPGPSGSMASSDTASASDAPATRPSFLRRMAQLGERIRGSKDDDPEPSLPASWKQGSPAAGPVTTAFNSTTSSGPASGRTTSSATVADNRTDKTPQRDPAAIPVAHSGPSPSSAANSDSAPPPPLLADTNPQTPTARPAPGPGPAPDQDMAPPSPIAQPSTSSTTSPPTPPSATSQPKPALPAVSPATDQPASSGGTTTTSGSISNWNPTPLSSLGSGQFVPTSGQMLYESPTYVEPPGKKCNLLNKICPLKKHQQVTASSQAPPTSQSCDTVATVKVKKPCFLKTFLHHKTCPGKGCGCAGKGGCEAHTLTASPQESLPSGQY